MAVTTEEFMYEYEGKEYTRDELKAILMAEINDRAEVSSSIEG